MADLKRFGYDEAEIGNHSIAWLNFTLLHERSEAAKRFKTDALLNLENAMLAGIMFNSPEVGQEYYQNLRAMITGEDDASDDAWLVNREAKTDMSALTQMAGFMQKKAADHARQRNSDERAGNVTGSPRDGENERDGE